MKPFVSKFQPCIYFTKTPAVFQGNEPCPTGEMTLAEQSKQQKQYKRKE